MQKSTTSGVTSLEDVIAEKRNQAIKFFDDSMFRISKMDTKAALHSGEGHDALNEDSLTDASIGREMFHTVCHPS